MRPYDELLIGGHRLGTERANGVPSTDKAVFAIAREGSDIDAYAEQPDHK